MIPVEKFSNWFRPSGCFKLSVLGFLGLAALNTLAIKTARAETEVAQITVLYDAFGPDLNMTKDWGFAALVEYGGKRILFDTGNNAEIFEHNVKEKGIDLSKLDFAVVSHRHGDHTSGLSYLLKVNPSVKIYVPQENFGVFGASLPGTFYKGESSLPVKMRYFDGKQLDQLRFGSPWPDANFEWVRQAMEIAPGLHLVLLNGKWGVDLEVKELSLVIETPDGLVVLVGCGHPTIEKIVAEAAKIGKRVHLVMGGLHLLPASDDQIESIANSLRNTWNVDFIAPTHCTGEPAFEALSKAFGENYVYAGLGSTVVLGPKITMKAEAGQRVKHAMDERDLRSYRDAIAMGPMRSLLGKGWSQLSRTLAH